MTLQQLRYLIAIAEYGSINAAAQNLYASQSNLSTAIKELEQELGITVFTRSNRGVTLTNDGTELLGYARQVIEQADMLEMRYADKGSTHLRLAVSTQHYAFSVQAFVNVVEGCKGEEYEFILRESTTAEIIETCARSAAKWASCTPTIQPARAAEGVRDATWPTLPCSRARARVRGRAPPAGGRHAAATRRPGRLPALLVRAGHYEFVLLFRRAAQPPAAQAQHPHLRPRHAHQPADQLQRIHLSTGVLSAEMHSGIASIPLDVDETMQVGYIMHNERRPSDLLLRYIDELHAIIGADPTVEPHL